MASNNKCEAESHILYEAIEDERRAEERKNENQRENRERK